MRRFTAATFIATLLFLTTVAMAGERVLHPNKQPKVVDLRPDDVTTIMGYRAELSGSLFHAPMPGPQMYKQAIVYNFTSPKDRMTWRVRAPEDGSYLVSLLYSGDDEILADAEIEVRNGEDRITMAPPTHTWEGKPFFIRAFFAGELPLRKGENRVELRMTKMPAGNAAAMLADSEELKKRQGLNIPDLLKTHSFGVWSIEFRAREAWEAMQKRAARVRPDATWMVEGKYGLFIHWSPQCLPLYGDKPRYQWHEKAVNLFDVEAFAGAVAETGAAWVCLTTSHGPQYWPGPNKTIDRILHGRTTERDLIGEMAAALKERGIRLMLYYHWSVHGDEDKAWARAAGAYEKNPKRWFDNMESLFREVSLRYGKRIEGIAYMDDCGFIVYQYDAPWERWSRAIKTGNPNALVGYSPSWGPSVSPFNELELTDGGGQLRGATEQQNFGVNSQHGDVIPARWFHVDGWVSRTPHNGVVGKGPAHPVEDYVRYFKAMDEANVPLTVNLQISADVVKGQPFFNPDSLDVMRAVRKAIRGK